jgi:hypothetical protein
MLENCVAFVSRRDPAGDSGMKELTNRGDVPTFSRPPALHDSRCCNATLVVTGAA